MKKLLFVAAVAAFTMTSCKKDFTCECTYDDGNGGSITQEYVMTDSKKAAAAAVCEGKNVGPIQVDGVTIEQDENNCTLK